MPSLLCLVLDHPPYGSLQPAEAVRHAGGALGKGWDVTLAFLGNAVYTVLAGQSSAGDWMVLGQAVSDLIGLGGDRARVLVDGLSLDARGLSAGDLIAGVEPASLGAIASAMAECDRTLVF